MRVAWKPLGAAIAVVVIATACSSSSTPRNTTPSTVPKVSTIPKSAFSTHIGITATSVSIGNVSATNLKLFTGAKVGVDAYSDYVNSKGGVNGRKLKVTWSSTTLQGPKFTEANTVDISKDFALVGDFSVYATGLGAVLKKNPAVADISVTVTTKNNELPNVVSPVPLQGGWQEGSLDWFKQKTPTGALHAGALVAKTPSAIAAWQGEKATMEHLGYKVVYTYDFTEASNYTNFVTDVISMAHAGVKMLFIEENPPGYALPVVKALASQNFHPTVILGASTYSQTMITITKLGGKALTNGMYLDQSLALYLGTDATSIPAVKTFLHWVQVAQPGFSPNLFTVYGWLSADLFAKALMKAGKDPSRGSLLAALYSIKKFTGSHLSAPTDPAAKTVSNCYLIGKIVTGKYERLTDPSVHSKTHGYRCDQQYYVP